MKDVISLIKFLMGFAAILLIIGSVGAMEQDSIGYTQCIIQAVVGYIILMIELKFSDIGDM